jgi:flagellar basal-body rod modification protein FlgD
MTTTGVSNGGTIPDPSVQSGPIAADKDTFLKLLVAQLKHQNPLEPADGLQFVSQLAQFTTLEHSASMRDDLAAIRQALEAGS